MSVLMGLGLEPQLKHKSSVSPEEVLNALQVIEDFEGPGIREDLFFIKQRASDEIERRRIEQEFAWLQEEGWGAKLESAVASGELKDPRRWLLNSKRQDAREI